VGKEGVEMKKLSKECRPLRADAVRNREKILAAAGVVFARRGLEGTLDEVASEAGVGVGTVYRRFPDKETLIAALFESAVDEIATLALSAYEAENSWEGLEWLMEKTLARQCVNRGLRDVLWGTSLAPDHMAIVKQRIGPAITQLLERAQRDGYLRDDVTEADFPILELMISSVGYVTNDAAPDLWRRYLTILLDGLVVKRDGPSPLHQLPEDHSVDDALRMAKGKLPVRRRAEVS
jgi:AcrR family transcriptional regulator